MQYKIKTIFILSLLAVLSCQTKEQNRIHTEFDWSLFSDNLKDSIQYMQNYGRIPNSVEGADAHRPKEFNKVKWILSNSNIDQLELLLYKHPNGVVKGIGINGLIRRKSPALIDHFKYAIDQDICVSYYTQTEKLGGYALHLVNYKVPGNLYVYFEDKNIEELKKLVEIQDFECSLN